jgi:hypothetical protein
MVMLPVNVPGIENRPAESVIVNVAARGPSVTSTLASLRGRDAVSTTAPDSRKSWNAGATAVGVDVG